MLDSLNNLLGVLHQQHGKELLFQPGQCARLMTDAGAHNLSANPLTHPQIGSLLQPIVTEEARRALQATAAAEFDYQCTGIGLFKVKIARTAAGFSASFKPAISVDASARPSAMGNGMPNGARPGAAEASPAQPAVRRSAPLPAPDAPVRQTAALSMAIVAPNAAPNASKMDKLFYSMVAMGASDLHLSVSMPPMVRKDGEMKLLDATQPPLTPEVAKELVTSILPEKNRAEYEHRNDTDFAYEIAGLARFRANIFRDRKGMGGVFRVIPNDILTAEKLGLSQHILKLCHLNKGLVLVTGPTGSGKSTTLCAMVDYVNRTRSDHVITIEDPIEFVHENKKCLINQREVHNHTDSFKDALRAALREDPDIILVGEMRDLETIAIAIETAETGHLVFGTLHTTTAASTVDRIIDQFPPDRQMQIRVMLSESLRAVISQTLLKKVGGGRVAALEVLIVNNAISNLIREGKTFQIASSMQTGRAQGNVMLNDALFELVKSKQVTAEEAYLKAVDKAVFESMLKRNNVDTRFIQALTQTS